MGSIEKDCVCCFHEFQSVARVVNSLQKNGINLFIDAWIEDLVEEAVQTCIKIRGVRSWSDERLCAEMAPDGGLSLICESSQKVKRCTEIAMAKRFEADFCDKCEIRAGMPELSQFQRSVDVWKSLTQCAVDAKLLAVSENWRAQIYNSMRKL